MKTLKLTLSTTRELTKEEYQDYKKMSGVGIDFTELEATGQTILTTHRRDEIVKTIYTLENIK